MSHLFQVELVCLKQRKAIELRSSETNNPFSISIRLIQFDPQLI
jgi:hypothetical protein